MGEDARCSPPPHTKYAFEPGTRYSYSNIGFAILGAALARVAQQPYVDYVQQKIFIPLDMTHTAFDATPDVRAHLSKGYQVKKGQVDSGRQRGSAR